MTEPTDKLLSNFIVDKIGFGIFAVKPDMEVVLWNRFMQYHSRKKSDDVIGKNLFTCFPDLPRKWLEKKFQSVFILKNFSFTSWEQRPYLFQFSHDRPVTGGIDWMQQNCTFMPLISTNGEVEMVCVTIADVTDICLMQRELEHALGALKESANRDGLTGIYNRRHLEERLAQEFSRYKRHGEEFSLIMFDLDHFKKVNDQHGHLAGDAVIKTAASRISNAIRSADIFGRYGGEEFSLVLPATQLSSAMIVAEKIRKVINETPVEFDGKELTISVSIGATVASQDSLSYEKLLNEADLALYEAKRRGRNCCVSAKELVNNN